MMKLTKFFSAMGALALALTTSLLPVSAPLNAADVIAKRNGKPNVTFYHVVSATADYTNATTSATDITGASVTVPANRNPGSDQYVRACYYADVTKGTATSGSIQVYVNDGAIAAATRSVQSASGRGALNSCYVVARPTNDAFVVKLRGISGDTNTFTVHNAQLAVEVLYVNR